MNKKKKEKNKRDTFDDNEVKENLETEADGINNENVEKGAKGGRCRDRDGRREKKAKTRMRKKGRRRRRRDRGRGEGGRFRQAKQNSPFLRSKSEPTPAFYGHSLFPCVFI